MNFAINAHMLAMSRFRWIGPDKGGWPRIKTLVPGFMPEKAAAVL